MRNTFKNILFILAGLSIGPLVAFAVQISVPSAAGNGYFLTSTTTGVYIATTTDPAHFGSIFATSSSATSRFQGALSVGGAVTLNTLNGLIAGNQGLAYASATTTLSGSGVISVTAGASTLGSAPVTVSCSTCGTGTVTSIVGGLGLLGGTITTSGTLSLASYIATSSAETISNLAYWTSTNGTPANLGKVATTSLTVSGFPANLPSTFGALVGGSGTWTYWGLATTTQPASSNLLVSNGIAGVYGVATTTLSGSGVIAVTAGATVVGSSPITVSCATCGTGTVTSIIGGNGLLGGTITTSGTFALASYIATSSQETISNIPFWTSTNGNPATLGKVATSTLTPTAPLGGSFTIINSNGAAGTLTCTGCMTAYDPFTHPGQFKSATTSFIGVGTSTPWAQLSVSTSTASAFNTPLFAVASSTNQTLLLVQGNGNVGIGTTTPGARLSLFAGQDYLSAANGPLFLIGSTTMGSATSTLFAVNNIGSTTLFQLPSKLLTTDSNSTIISSSTLSAAYGGTGVSILTANQIPYVNGAANGFSFVGTTSATCGTGVSCTGFNVLGGSNPTFALATMNAGVLGSVTSGVAPTSQATSTLFGAASTPGFVLTWTNNNGGGIILSATSSAGSGTVTSITGGNGLLGGAITTSGTLALASYLATSSAEAISNLPYWTSTAGTPAKLGTVATTSISVGTSLSVTGGSLGAQVGGAAVTINTIQGIRTADSPSFTGLTVSGLTTGSVPFAGAGGLISQNNAKFFWDNTNARLGIGTTTPFVPFDIATSSASTGTFGQLALTDNNAGANLKHWLLSSLGGNFYLGSTTDAYATSTTAAFSILANGQVSATSYQPATSTAITLNWVTTPNQVEYQIGAAAVTISLINATTAPMWGSRKVVWICNPGTTAGALTWTGVEWVGSAPTQTTTASNCDVYSFDITRATSTSAYKVSGAAGTGFQ